jgi:hypothetical protein
MGGIKFLDPIFGDLTDTIDHGGLANSRTADEQKGGGDFLLRVAVSKPGHHGFFNLRMKTCCFFLG